MKRTTDAIERSGEQNECNCFEIKLVGLQQELMEAIATDEESCLSDEEIRAVADWVAGLFIGELMAIGVVEGDFRIVDVEDGEPIFSLREKAN